MPCVQRSHDEIKVRRFTRVVEARTAIRKHPREILQIARARTEVDRGRAESTPRDDRKQTLDVHGVGAAFEAVHEDEVCCRVVGLPGCRQVIEHKNVAVRRLDLFTLEFDCATRTDEPAPDGL